MSINTLCFKCRKPIDTDKEKYYVFIGKTVTIGNKAFCIICRDQEVEYMKDLDPFIAPLYSKNFIKMNE